MTRWSPRLCTGTRSRTGALAVLAAGLLVPFLPASGRAQALKLDSLTFPPSAVVGPWVSYRVRTQSRSLPVREYTQRVAIVSRDSYEGRQGFWVELKTEGLSSGTRIERGFFATPGPGSAVSDDDEGAPGDSGEAAPAPPARANKARLLRYQVLTGGKLYEYPVERASEERAGGMVSTVELFEYDSNIPPIAENLGPDTLRIGNRVVPATKDRTRRAGADDWPIRGDTTVVNRPVLTQTFWRNGAVPITGLARSLFQVSFERVSAAAKDTAAIASPPPPLPESTTVNASVSLKAMTSDSVSVAAGAGTAGTPGATGASSVPAAAKPVIFSWTDVQLLDLGADAKPEVTQKPEPIPSDTGADTPPKKPRIAH